MTPSVPVEADGGIMPADMLPDWDELLSAAACDDSR